MPDWLKTLLTIAATLVVAYLSSFWATRKAFQERWWERKERAYSDIVEALHDLIRFSEICAADSESGTEDENPKKKEFRDRYSEAYWKIEKATDIGAFVICDKAAEILANLRDKPKLDCTENPPWEIYRANCEHYKIALAKIKECARKDLKI